jgi:hypothetical protein
MEEAHDWLGVKGKGEPAGPESCPAHLGIRMRGDVFTDTQSPGGGVPWAHEHEAVLNKLASRCLF